VLIFYHKYIQFEFFRPLKGYANMRGIQIIDDIPIAHDSADVWANPEIFAQTTSGNWMADYFSATARANSSL